MTPPTEPVGSAARSAVHPPRVLLVAPSPGSLRSAVDAGLDTWAVWDPRLCPPASGGMAAGLLQERLLAADFDDPVGLHATLAEAVRTHAINHVLRCPSGPDSPAAPGTGPAAPPVEAAPAEAVVGHRIRVETLSVHGMHLLARVTADAPAERLPAAALPAIRAAVRAVLDVIGQEAGTACTDLVLATSGCLPVTAPAPVGPPALAHRLW